MDTTEKIICKPIADLALMYCGAILLVKYSDTNKYDHQKGWFLPDDLLHSGELPADAANRILHEQLGLENIKAELDHIESFIGNDNTWHLTFHFVAEINHAPETKTPVDVESIKWFPVSRLPEKNEVAHHGWALNTIKSILSKKETVAAQR